MRARVPVLIALTVALVIPAAHPAPALPTVFDCADDGYAALDLAWEKRAWNGGRILPLVDKEPRDASGVRMYLRDGRLYNHPVLQANYGLLSLWSYTKTNDARYLTRAKAQAQRLLDRSRLAGQGLFFPYPFDFRLHGYAELMRAPWYSGMAQGMALALFTRLHERTGDAKWLDAATKTYTSFLRLRSDGTPWFNELDQYGYLWIQEYPGSDPDDTFNGHMFGAFGLYDYYLVTRDQTALRLFSCSVTTVRRYARYFRNPAWISLYCLRHRRVDAKYHHIHGAQMLRLYSYTGSYLLARNADSFASDFPPPASGTVRFIAGTHSAYRFSSSGAILSSKRATLTRTSIAPAEARQRIRGRYGYWYLIDSGAFAGYWIREVPRRTFMLGRYHLLGYTPGRSATIEQGTHRAYLFDGAGQALSSRTRIFSDPTEVSVDQSAYVNGSPYLRITDGAFAGYMLARDRIASVD